MTQLLSLNEKPGLTPFKGIHEASKRWLNFIFLPVLMYSISAYGQYTNADRSFTYFFVEDVMPKPRNRIESTIFRASDSTISTHFFEHV
jgi:hypothetical protein